MIGLIRKYVNRRQIPMSSSKNQNIYTLAFMGVMSAVVFVSNYFSIPIASSRIHLGNVFCLLAGLLFGGIRGGLIAAVGSALFDLTFPAYAAESWITFINKGSMALLCGMIAHKETRIPGKIRVFIAALSGAVLYIALYIFKSYIQLAYVTCVPAETILPVLLQKLVASSINGLFAVMAAPALFTALSPALKKAGLYQKFQAK